ncbi:MAG TPA: tol-pal system protein YbgF [Rhizomicrobium sp.]
MNPCSHAWARSAVAAAVFAMVATLADAAQTVDPPANLAQLAARIDAGRAQIQQLQSGIARAQARAGFVQVADLFGESDEEKAERLRLQQREQAQDSSIATLNQRLNDLEETLRRLTGQMEQVDHRVGEFNDRITRMQKDFDYKLCSLSAQQLGATNDTGEQSALPCPGQQAASPAPGQNAPPATGAPRRLAAPPGVLGTLPQGAITTPSPQEYPRATAPAPSQSADTRARFDAAMNLLARAQYDEARAAFRSFADTYPADDLAPQAIYWVGDIAYVQKDYPTASRSFAEELKKYPQSPRGPESMLKLGQSLLAMDQKKEGCLVLGQLTGKYPDASKTVAERALAARRTAGCR